MTNGRREIVTILAVMVIYHPHDEHLHSHEPLKMYVHPSYRYSAITKSGTTNEMAS